ncbi:hypothetical protein [Actinomadura kijaniata]|uniref:hypothetical protein n=1 Tax=Actinomadura kijaniata TaxID=46161 RepID=UPI0012F8D79A|nr:hypothetical protein [Actinomadura kijaniata]
MPSDGRRHVGPLETIVHRHWPTGTVPPRTLIAAVDRLASLPAHLTGRLLEGLTAFYIGMGAVTDYPPFADLTGQPIDPARPEGPQWQHIPAGYRDRQIVIGSGSHSLSIDVTLHEIFHAMDDLDGWISSSPDFRALHWSCSPVLADDRYVRQRAEFFAEAGAVVTLRAWDVLEAMLSGHTHRAYAVRSWFSREYGVGR